MTELDTLKYYAEMDLTDKHIRWCWKNNWFVDIVPMSGQNGAKYPRVKVELHQRTDNGTRLMQVGNDVFEQKTASDKILIANEVNRVYQLVYNKHNK
tara:strand:+ start:275 stop:565 length:291 start_codon:yes stop_codon:yes gene_type:complete